MTNVNFGDAHGNRKILSVQLLRKLEQAREEMSFGQHITILWTTLSLTLAERQAMRLNLRTI